MSDTITLSFRQKLSFETDISPLLPERLASLSNTEIAALSVWVGTQSVRLGDLCDVAGERASTVRLEGDVSQVIGLGAGMRGGRLIIAGNAGDEVGREMKDGEIFVQGSVGRSAGMRARRGLITVGGDAGDNVGHAMIAGTVCVMGRATGRVGPWNKRGTIIALNGAEPLPTYRYACTYRPVILRVLFTYLNRSHGFAIDDRFVAGQYARYSGDLGELGKGELLTWRSH